MSAAPPPPPQLGLPPPPMPGGGGGGPPPPPSAAVPPPMNNRMNHHQRGPPRNPYTNQILLTDIPPFLHSLAAIREWLYPCGTTRTVVLYPKPKTSDDDNENKKDDKGATKEEAEEKGTALITMSHPDAAVKVVGSFPVFSAHLDERYNGIQVYLIPPSPELPLPPISMDKETKQVLGEKLWSQWVTLESNQGPTHNPMNRNSYNNNNSSNDKTGDAADITLDADKVAAAAGGVQYDEDDDPLSAPHVLEAVKQFRRNLLTTSSSQQKQRLALVQRTLERMRPVIRQRVDQEKANASAVPLPNPNLPPPPMPGGLPPPPPPSAAGGGGGADSGKRGRSNLPAWMTAQQEAGGDGEGEPDAKKSKTQAETFPTNIPEAKHADLRTFISSQISEFMGEAPDDLVDMVHSHVIGGKATQALVTELQEVLEDDTQTLIQAVWNKVNELL